MVLLVGESMNITVRVPGSCGELVQGCADGEPFLITCPIDRYSTAVVADDGLQRIEAGTKGKAALKKTLQYIQAGHFPFSLYVSSDLPKGKGMASSSADIGAVIIAAAAACGTALTEQEIACIAASIEPTDGVFCRGVVAINYKTGAIRHSLGILPAMRIAIFDLGGTIDTLAFHQQYAEQEIRCGLVLDHLPVFAAQMKTAERIGNAATQSALAHQAVLYKPYLSALLHMGKKWGAVGINIGHSGTVCGLLFPPDYPKGLLTSRIGPAVAGHLPVSYMGPAVLRSGGWMMERR